MHVRNKDPYLTKKWVEKYAEKKTKIHKAVVGRTDGKKLHQSWSGQTGQKPKQQNGDDDIRMLSKSEKGEIWKIETIFFFFWGRKNV